jgi:hypothetical protein
MMMAIGADPYWACDRCFDLIGHGLALHSQSGWRGHFPAVKVVCGQRCAELLEATLIQPVRRMDWQTLLAALTTDRRGAA